MSHGYTYYSDICLIFIVTGIICGIVRLIHHCRPYDKEIRYFYPASSLTAFVFMAVAMLTPYYLHPEAPGTWVFVRVFGVVFYPAAFAAMFLRYFKWHKLRSSSAILLFYVPMSLLFIMTCSVLYAPVGVWFEVHSSVVLGIASGIGIILTAYMLKTLIWLKSRISAYNKGNFSDDSDFPHKFAGKVMYLPVVWTAIVWAVLLADSRVLNMVAEIIMSVWMVLFLCLILHPQRLLRPKYIEEQLDRIGCRKVNFMEEAIIAAKEEEVKEAEASEPESNEARRQVLEIILQKYREPHL